MASRTLITGEEGGGGEEEVGTSGVANTLTHSLFGRPQYKAMPYHLHPAL